MGGVATDLAAGEHATDQGDAGEACRGSADHQVAPGDSRQWHARTCSIRRRAAGTPG